MLNPDDAVKELCSRSLARFVREAWHVLEPDQPYTHGWHIDAMAEHLEAVSSGEITRLLINVPPGTMKSMMTAVFWPAWEWGPFGYPSMRMLGASNSADNALRDNIKMRRLIESEWYQQKWPIKFVGDQNQKTYFENDQTGWRQSCAARAMTSKRGDRVLWDDPHTVEDAHSPAALREAQRVFRETLPTRLNNPATSAIIVIMQRLSLADEEISQEIINNPSYGYVHLMLPMEYEPARRCVTVTGFEDPRKEEGELLFPERFPKEVVAGLKAILRTAAPGQLQQNPVKVGGNIIKGEWFRRYTTLPPQLKYRMIYADTAQKTKEHNDYSVFEEWGLSQEGRICLIDMIRGKWPAPELRRRAADFWAKCAARDTIMYGHLRAMKPEDKSSGTGLIQELTQPPYNIPVIGIQRDRDKYSRVNDVLPRIESGFVYIPESAPFVSEFITECEAFTADDSHPHDDQIDPMVDAITDMLGEGTTKLRIR